MAFALTVDLEPENGEPISYSDAMSSQHNGEWHQAVVDEMDSLLRNQTWLLVKKPLNHKVISVYGY